MYVYIHGGNDFQTSLFQCLCIASKNILYYYHTHAHITHTHMHTHHTHTHAHTHIYTHTCTHTHIHTHAHTCMYIHNLQTYYPSFLKSSIYLRFLNELVHMLNNNETITNTSPTGTSSTQTAGINSSTVDQTDAPGDSPDLDDPDYLWRRPHTSYVWSMCRQLLCLYF